MSEASATALFLSAPASGQGKTTITAGIARCAMRQGLRVRVFKAGPDFIDPTILERASGQPVYQLDLWMGGLDHCRQLLHEAALGADLILIEGVMGLHDGQPSSAELAQRIGVPVAAIIDANAMAETFGALALGLREYRTGLALHGVIANRVGGAAHTAMLAASLSSLHVPMRLLAALPHDDAFRIPDRHLGLVQGSEIADLDARVERVADALSATLQFDRLPTVAFAAEPPLHAAMEETAGTSRPLEGVRVAVARDEAFSFIYPANLDLLRTLGATVHFFSPLRDAQLPAADALYLPGGYPELHAEQLAANCALHQGLRAHARAGRPLLAECGGMMLLFERLIDLHGRAHPMAGLLPGETAMQPRLQGLALQSAALEQGELRGHSFHHSRLATPLVPTSYAVTQRGGVGEALFRVGRLTASYVHFYWPSNPLALAGILAP